MSTVLAPARTTIPARNERLRDLLTTLGMSPAALASRLGVDPKTVERWICHGRTPYPRIAAQAARLLDVEVTYLWPDIHARRNTSVSAADELVATYPGRAAVPYDLWTRLLTEASHRIDIMGDLGLSDLVPNLTRLLVEKAGRGIPVRVVLADPATATNPADTARAMVAEAVFTPLASEGVIVRRYPGALATTILRIDSDLIVRTTLDGCPSALAPVLHLRSLTGGPLSSLYLTSLDTVTDSTIPVRTGLRSVVAA